VDGADEPPYRVFWSPEDNEYVGICSEFSFLSHLDPDRETALRGIRALVNDVVADMRASAEQIPPER
jgi:hypothetical protein